ncbi:unnamed protein product [Rhizoctonia solani]|uniref:Uncharacterized protein n=1 Tax=Rhizoctonia solani TaxID=456999 RepID=A0A8H3B589_9AGAM|nr:unnamed protein product [Rhizoctonia solani]
MPGRATRGILIDCYCRLEKYADIPHRVSMQTRFCHQEEAKKAEQAAEHEAMEIDLHKDKDKDIQDAEGYLQEDIGPQEHELDNHDIYSHDLDACSDYGPSEDSDAGDGWSIPADLQGAPLWQKQCTIVSQLNGESIP